MRFTRRPFPVLPERDIFLSDSCPTPECTHSESLCPTNLAVALPTPAYYDCTGLQAFKPVYVFLPPLFGSLSYRLASLPAS